MSTAGDTRAVAAAPRESEDTHSYGADIQTHQHSCSRCGNDGSEYISLAQYRKQMRLTRLQIAIPISVLVSLGTMLVCGVAIKPGIRGINNLYPTLLSPNPTLIIVYWSILFGLMVGFCILLVLAQSDNTKEEFVNGVGMTFAVVNWLQAAWAVCWTLRAFVAAEVFTLVNLVLLLSIHLFLINFPPSIFRPFRAMFIHGTIVAYLILLFTLTAGHNGFVALKWVIREHDTLDTWKWQSVGYVAGANTIVLLWEMATHQYFMTVCAEYILFALLFATPRMSPSLPDSEITKPPALLFTIIIFLVLHPLALVGSNAYRIHRNRTGQIRLPDDEDDPVEAAREAEIEAEVEARVRAREADQGSHV